MKGGGGVILYSPAPIVYISKMEGNVFNLFFYFHRFPSTPNRQTVMPYLETPPKQNILSDLDTVSTVAVSTPYHLDEESLSMKDTPISW